MPSRGVGALPGVALCLVLLVPGGAAGPLEAAEPQELEISPARIEAVRDAVYPALVNLTVVNQRFGEGRAHRFPGAGSGVVMTPEGHVLTNFHVAGDTVRIEATLTDGRVYPAQVVVHDPLTDLSVLRLEIPEGAPSVAHAEFGDSAALEVGDTVFAMGNPLALSSSMSQGIVSNPARVFTDFTGTQMQELNLDEDQKTGLLTRWIQHDALILPGNSGGPLIDLAGDVVGINELGGGGLGFAIPSTIARGVLAQALEKGEVERGWLGFSVLPVQKIGRADGALVSNVLPEGAARGAGLEAGDILRTLAGEPVSVRFFEEVPLLYQRIAELSIGSVVALEVERDGERLALEAEVEKMPPFRGEEEEIRSLGITAQVITGPMAISRNLPDPDGLLVTGVRPGSPADDAKPSIGSEDVLRSVKGVPVDGLEGLRSRIRELSGEQEMMATLWRNEQEILSVIPLEDRARSSWGGELPKAWLGVRTQVLTPDLVRAMGLEDRRGFRITQVLPWTEASEAGLRVGDLLVAVEGEPLEAERPQDSQDLRRIVEELTIGEEAELTVFRDGAETTIPVLMEPKPTEPEEAEKAEQEELEFVVRDLTLLDRIERRWSRELEGVMVEDATMGGWAHMAGLRLGDLIMEINGRPVPDVDRFETVMERLVEERSGLVKIFLRRGERTHFVLIEPDWEALTGSGEASEKEAA